MITLSHTNHSEILSNSQLRFLAHTLPEPAAVRGRPAYRNDLLLEGIVLVLRSGCRWKDLNRFGGPSGVTHWRRLQFWQQSGAFIRLWKFFLTGLNQQQKLHLLHLSLDGTFIPSFAFRECTGYSGKEKRTGVKVSVVVEGEGLPLAAVIATGNTHDTFLVPETFTHLRISYQYLQKSILFADKGYDNRFARSFLEQRGLQTSIAHKQDRSPPETTIGHYRYVVERTHAWLKNNRRLHFRFERTKRIFEAFVSLAILVILIKKLMS